jgi:hypothetical protein
MQGWHVNMNVTATQKPDLVHPPLLVVLARTSLSTLL